jgi:hypothetical protein
MCLPALPGYAPRGTADRAGQARLALGLVRTKVGTLSSSEEKCDVPVPGENAWLVAATWLIRGAATTLVGFYIAGLSGITRTP